MNRKSYILIQIQDIIVNALKTMKQFYCWNACLTAIYAVFITVNVKNHIIFFIMTIPVVHFHFTLLMVTKAFEKCLEISIACGL